MKLAKLNRTAKRMMRKVGIKGYGQLATIAVSGLSSTIVTLYGFPMITKLIGPWYFFASFTFGNYVIGPASTHASNQWLLFRQKAFDGHVAISRVTSIEQHMFFAFVQSIMQMGVAFGTFLILFAAQYWGIHI